MQSFMIIDRYYDSTLLLKEQFLYLGLLYLPITFVQSQLGLLKLARHGTKHKFIA